MMILILTVSQYIRTIELNDIQEEQNISFNEIKAEMQIGYKQNKWEFSVGAGLGILNIVDTDYSSSANAKYSGFYDDLFGITLSENGVYDFGDYSLSESGSINTNSSVETNHYFFTTAFHLNQNFSIKASIRYTQLSESIFDTNNPRISNDFSELNSISSILSYNLNFINSGLGLRYKF